MSKNELFENLYNRTRKICDMLKQPSPFPEEGKDSIIIANIGKDDEKDKENNINIKSYDTLDKADLIDYSLKPNGILETSKLKDSISNSYFESSENGSTAKKEGFITSEGKMVRIDITKYKSIVLKYGKISFIKDGFMNNAFVSNNDIIFLETKIPLFKAKDSNNMIYDTLRNYHQIGSDKEDTNYLININQRNSHKINLDEKNISTFVDSKIYIFLHKSIPISNSNNKKNNSAKKKVTNAPVTEADDNPSIIIGYTSLEMKHIFLSEDFKFIGKINLMEKMNPNKKNEKNSGKGSSSNIKNKTKGKGKEKKDKIINEALYDEKGERVIGSIEISCYLKRPYSKMLEEDEKKLSSSINKLIKQNNNENNNNNINIENNKINQSPMKEFVIGQPPMYNNQKINEINNNFNGEDLNKRIEEHSQNGEEKLMIDDGMEKIRTDINGDILILYLRINELKSSINIYNSENSIPSNINPQLNNFDQNKNIIFYNYSGPQLPRHNFFLRHKIFPENKDANSEIIWGKVMPNFNYSIQMPFTLNQKTVELMDSGKFIVEIWTKGENNNSCLGFVSFDLRNVLDSLKVNEDTITTLQLYKSIMPYIIYNDFYQVTQLNESQELGTIYLKVCMGIGTPSQVHNFDNLLKKAQNQPKIQPNFNEQFNGMYNTGNMNMNMNNNNVDNINNINNQNEKNNISLDPFQEDIKEIDKNEINPNNVSKAADINVEKIFEKNKRNLENNNNMLNSKEISINQNLKKSESFEEHQPNKKKIMNPFLVPQNYEQENDFKGSKKETAKFNKLINSENNFNFEGSNRYNNQNNYNNYNNTDYKENREKKIYDNDKYNQPNININIDMNSNKVKENENYKYNIQGSFGNNNMDNNNKINNLNNINDKFNLSNKYDKNDFNNNYNNNNIKNENNEENIEEDINNNNDDYNYMEKENEKEKENQQPINNYNEEKNYNPEENLNEKEKNIDLNMNMNINEKNEINNNNIDNNYNKNDLELIDDKNLEKENDKNINIEINTNNNNINIENISSHVKKHIFTISIEKIYNCQILSKLPPTYLRYQFFTDQKPLRSELFTFSQYSVDSSVIDVDMKSIHSIILPKVEKIKDYLNDFLVEFLYDNPHKKNNYIIIGRVNIPSDEFASLISERDSLNKKNMNELSRVLFIYGTEKIQRNKCIIGKLKLSFKYTNIDVPINSTNLFNGSLNNSNNNFLISSMNNNLGPNFAGSIYLEKETIFNRKIPKNAVLKINVEKFSSTPLFEDYFRKQFSIHFVFSIFGEVAKMENQYGKRSTSKKHNLLNCDFDETLSYKVEIDQDIIDYLKCRNGIVYLVYKITKEKKNFRGLDNEENLEEKYNSENEDLNMIDFENISKNKKIIGKGIFNLNEILTSADTNYKEISISQIGNGSMSLGTLNISLTLENDNSGINGISEDKKEQNNLKYKKGLSNNTSDLYKLHNISFNKCDPCLYLNGKFLFSINFTKFYYEINSELGAIINNYNDLYFVFKLGNKIKKISPKFNQENNELFSLNINSNLILINYVEMIELDLNFNRKLPNDLYNLFNEGIFEIKLYQNENANSLGSFYIDLHKLIVSEFFSENILYSGNNVINLINVNNNSYKNCKIEVNLAIFKLNEMQLNSDIANKINYLSNNIRKDSNNINNNNEISNQEISMSNLDYCEYYQNLFVKDYANYIIQGLFFSNETNSDKNKEKEENMNMSDLNAENLYSIEKIRKILNYNNIDMFGFINNNLINLVDNKGEINFQNFKKVFNLITKLNLEIFDFYFNSSLKPENSNFNSNTFEYYLNSRIINLDNEDSNILNFLKDKQNKIDIGISNNSSMNQNSNKTMKKLLTINYNYGFNETNDYLDVVSLCLFIFDYYYNLNNDILMNALKIKNNNFKNNLNENNNTYSKTQPLIYKKEQQYFNHTLNNINTMNLNDFNNNNRNMSSGLLDKYGKNFMNKKTVSKIMLISVLSGHNIIKPNSDFTSRPNCYFILEFDDKNYTSDVVMNSSHPNFNEELEIKIKADEYIQKLNSLNIYISVFSYVDDNNSVLIGRCEINPAKMFPFLNESNECEDFFHIVGEGGQVMGQLFLKFKFEGTKKENGDLYLSSNNLIDNLDKKSNNTISYPLNNAFDNFNNKNNFMKTTGNDADSLHKRLEEALNSIDDLTQILKNKVENEKKEKEKDNRMNINNPNNIQINNNNMVGNKMNNNNFEANMNNGENEEKIINDMNGEEQYNEMENNNEEEMNQEEYNEEMIENNEEQMNNEEGNNMLDNGNNNINDNNLNNNNINENNNDNDNDYENKLSLTEYNNNINLNNSQKMSQNEEENDKASFYSEAKEKNGKNKKMKYLKNYDKNLLNKIQRIMKNKK